jgi:hypothetical protein
LFVVSRGTLREGADAGIVTAGHASSMKGHMIDARVAWRRETASRHYVGTLWGSGTEIRLTGHEPATGISAELTIPLEDVERIGLSTWDGDRLVGEPCLVLELSDGVPILLRRVGVGELATRELGREIERLQEGGLDESQ